MAAPGQDIREYEPEQKSVTSLPAAVAVPVFDPSEYRQYVDDFDISDEQKDELLRTLYSIMLTFVDLGFGVDSVQRVLPALAEISSSADSGTLENRKPLFNEAALPAEEEQS